MPEPTASIRLQLAGADQVLAELRQVAAQLHSLGIAGGGVPSGGGPALPGVSAAPAGGGLSVGAGPPTPVVPAGSASAAAAAAGSPQIAAAANAGPMAAAAATGGTLAAVGAALGGQRALTALESLASQTAAGYGVAGVMGRPYHAESAWGGGVRLAGTAIGGALGFMAGGLPGAGLGAYAGATVFEPLAQIADSAGGAAIANKRLAQYAAAVGMGAPVRLGGDMAQFAVQQMEAGRPIASEALRAAEGWDSKPGHEWSWFDDTGNVRTEGYVKKEFQALWRQSTSAAMGTEAARRRGTSLDWSERLMTPEGTRELARTVMAENPTMAYGLAASIEDRGLVRQALAMDQAQARFAAAGTLYGSASGRLQAETSFAGQFVGAGAMLAGIQRQTELANAHAAQMRAQAALRRAANPADTTAQVLDDQAAAMELAAAGDLRGGMLTADVAVSDARFAGASGAAARAIRSAMVFGGADAAYGMQASALRGRAADRRRQSRFMGAEAAALAREEARALDFEASFGVAQQSQMTAFGLGMAQAGLAGAQLMGAAAPGLTYGSAVEQAGAAGVQAQAAALQRAALERGVAGSPLMPLAERLAAQTQMENLRALETRMTGAGAAAQAGARFQTTALHLAEAAQPAALALMAGAGGAEATQALAMQRAQAESLLDAKRRELAELTSPGGKFSAESAEAQRRRGEILELEQRALAARNAEATVPLSGRDQATLSRLGAQNAFFASGYGGSQGAMRANLLGMIGVYDRQLGAVDAAEAAAREAGKGRLTQAQEATFAAQRSQYAMAALGAMQQYDEGWDQRMISQAYAMTSGGALGMASFSRREATLFGGVASRALGGSRGQMDWYRLSMPGRFASMLGDGSAAGFGDRAVAEATRIQVEVTVRDGQNRPLEATQRVVRDAPTLAPLMPGGGRAAASG